MDDWARPELNVTVEVFATGDSEMLTPDDETFGAFVDVVRRNGAAVLDVHARRGRRPGTPIATTSGRRSGPYDIVRPVLVDPRRASALAADGDLFREHLEGLDVDDHQADDGGRFLVWTGRLSGAHIGPVPVALHLLASPSLVVTVLELVPQDRLRWHRSAFIAAGVQVVDVLADRLGRLAAPTLAVATAS